MLYNDFILSGITLEEITLIEKYANIKNLEFSENNKDLCLINSDTEEVVYRGLADIVSFVRKNAQEEFDANNYCDIDRSIKEHNIIKDMELKLSKYQQVA